MSREGLNKKERITHKTANKVIFLSLAASALALTVSLAVAFMLLFFPVTEIEIEGNSRYSYSELVRISGVELGDRLYYVDKDKTAQQLIESCVYLQNVTVHTYFPNRLKIEIEEYEDIYIVRHERGYAYLGGELKVLEIVNDISDRERYSGILVKTGSAISEEVGEHCYRRDLLLAMGLTAKIRENGSFSYPEMVDIENEYNISFITGEKYIFVVGAMSDVTEKLSLISKAVASDSFKQNGFARVDATDKKMLFLRYVTYEYIISQFDF